MNKEITQYNFQEPTTEMIPKNFTKQVADHVPAFHRQLPGYHPIECIALEELAKNWGVGDICMRFLANPLGGDKVIKAGESGSVGIGVLELLTAHSAFDQIKERLEIGPASKALLFNTEGATDPVNYQEIQWHGKYPPILPSE